MTNAQAREELARLANGMNHDLRDTTDEEVASWMRVLMSVPYERGRAAVQQLIDTWTYRRFPLRGDFMRIVEGMSMDGVANAGAYSQGGQASTQDPEQAQIALERHERWNNMTAEEYAEELEGFRRRGWDPMRQRRVHNG